MDYNTSDTTEQTQFVIRYNFNVADLTLNIQDFLFQEPLNTSPPKDLVLPSSVNALISSISNIWGTVTSLVALTSYLNKQASFPEDPAVPEITEPQTPEFARLAQQYLETCQLTLSKEGVGGTYFLEDPNGANFAVFKPVDEEPGAPNNPKNLVTEPLLPPGGGAAREAAAYLLDRGFAGVPPTYMLQNVTTASHGLKTGSVQQFVSNDGESSSIGSSSFLTADVHRIGALDIRLFNMDRNGENMLLKKSESGHHLIPIDHAYSLPESLSSAYFEWMYWPQAKRPFDDETREYILSVNVEEDAEILRSLAISEKSIRTMKVSSMLLKECTKKNWNLFQIAEVICRDFTGKKPSRLEELVDKAQLEADRDKIDFYEAYQHILEQEVHHH